MRLLGSILVAVAIVFWLGVSLRFYGYAKSYMQLEHPFLKNQKEVIAHRGGAGLAPENTLEALEKSAALSPEIILHVDLQISKDGEFVLFRDPGLERTTDGRGLVREQTYSELSARNAGHFFSPDGGKSFPYREKSLHIPLLKEALLKFPNHRFILDVQANALEIDKKLFQLVRELNAQNRVMIISSYGAIVQHGRLLEPRWVYGASRDEVMRSVMYASLWLESTDSMRADVYVIADRDAGVQILTDRLLTEIHRRAKKVFLLNVNTAEEAKKWFTESIDGIYTDYPDKIIALAQEFSAQDPKKAVNQ